MYYDILFTDDDKFEVELKSDANTEIQKMIPNAEDHYRHLQQLIDNILDQKVAKTDMKLRHIVTKLIEVAGFDIQHNIYFSRETVFSEQLG